MGDSRSIASVTEDYSFLYTSSGLKIRSEIISHSPAAFSLR
jgi:hypothetical protein